MKNSLELKNEVLSDIQKTTKLSVDKMRLQEEISFLTRDFFLLKEQVADLENQKSLIAHEISSKSVDIEKTKSRLKTLQEAAQEVLDLSKDTDKKRLELNQLNIELSEKEVLKDELEIIKSQIITSAEELRNLHRQTQILVVEHDQIIDSAHNHAAAIRDTAQVEVNEVMSAKVDLDRRELAVSAKEKYLAERERGLATVESRWRRLYETKGVNFKI